MNTEFNLYQQHLQRAAPSFHQHAFLVHEVARRLLERLPYIRFQPRRILDVAAKTGVTRKLLSKQYPKANIIACEIEPGLLQQIHAGFPWKRSLRLCNTYTALPLVDSAVDMVLANLSLPFVGDLAKSLQEWKRVIAPSGTLFFSTFGPDTFKELLSDHPSRFIDMHDIGDLLLQLGFENPVVDMEYLTLEYNSIDKLHRDMAQNALQSLLPKSDIKFEDGRFSVTIELIYGHAWMPKLRQSQTRNEFNEVLIPVDQLIKPKRQGVS